MFEGEIYETAAGISRVSRFEQHIPNRLVGNHVGETIAAKEDPIATFERQLIDIDLDVLM